MTEMIGYDLFDLIVEDSMHCVEKIKSRVMPFIGDQRYVGLLDNERIVVGEFSCASPVKLIISALLKAESMDEEYICARSKTSSM